MKHKYRQSTKKSKVSPNDLLNFFKKIISASFFSDFINLDHPFQLDSIRPDLQPTQIIPEKVLVSVLSNLNLKVPASKGELKFEKGRFTTAVTENFKELTT